MTVLAAALALLAALLFSVSTVVQQRVAAASGRRGLALLLHLVRQPPWLLAALAELVGFGLAATALALSSLLLVQPLLVTVLVLALPLAARRSGSPLLRRDRVWAGVLTVALVGFVVLARPTPGRLTATPAQWWPTATVLGVAVVALVVTASRMPATPRAVLLGAATAICFGVSAALTKGAAGTLVDGIPALLGRGEVYALVVVSVSGTVLQQSAYQAGPLAASLPVMTAGEPVVGAAVGVLVLGEQLSATGARAVAVGLLVATMAVAAAALARSSGRVRDRR